MVHLPLASFPIVTIYLFLRRGYRLVTVCVCFHEIDDEKPQKARADISRNHFSQQNKEKEKGDKLQQQLRLCAVSLHVYSWRRLQKVTQIKRWHRDQYASFGTNIVRLYSIKRHSVYIIAQPPFLRCCTTTFFTRSKQRRRLIFRHDHYICSVSSNAFLKTLKTTQQTLVKQNPNHPLNSMLISFGFNGSGQSAAAVAVTRPKNQKKWRGIYSFVFFLLFGFSKGPRNLTVTPHTL